MDSCVGFLEILWNFPGFFGIFRILMDYSVGFFEILPDSL